MKLEVLEKDHTYHIYNRGVNGDAIFKEDENKRYFLSLYEKHLADMVTCFAYCLMNNHYHFILRIDEDEAKVSQAMSNFLNAYAKAFNKRFERTGSLFEKHFKRKRLDNETYLRNLIIYVNKNPKKYKEYSFSSYRETLKGSSKIVDFESTLSYFDGRENFIYAHENNLQDVIEGRDLLGEATLRGVIEGRDLPGEANLRGVVEGRDLLVGLESNQASDLQGFQNLAGQGIKEKFYQYIQDLQDTITQKLEEVDGKAKFQQDFWERPEGGGGRTRVIENGNVFEKGGVNISAVHGALPATMQQYFGVKDADFFACGLSLVLHPKNPMVPTVHANWRYFEMYDKEGTVVDQWFGGGQDLTPYYLFEEDGKHFHQICKTACDKHHPDFYANYKKKCDKYFWNAHRNEARGLGGLFFDYCKKTEEMSMEHWYNFVTEVGNSFLEAYVPIVEKRKELGYTKEQRDWQEIRRGRYVEFNLVHDKGTLFGLKTNGRIESILMSLPPHVQWVYDHHPQAGSQEEKLIKVLMNPVDWV